MSRPTPSDLLAQRWYAVPDTMIGGWAVANVGKDTASHDYEAGEGDVAWGLHEDVALHIADLHNAALETAS